MPGYFAECDVADSEAAERFVKDAEERLGPIDLLINNAGITKDSPLVLGSAEDWHAVLATNLTGTWNFCRAMAFRFMKNRGGAVVNMSSVAGVYGHAGQTAYSASKAGIIGFSKSLAKEVGGHGVRVNVVAPGFIETDMTGVARRQARARRSRGSRPSASAPARTSPSWSRSCCSDRASYITGQVLQVDGGITL